MLDIYISGKTKLKCKSWRQKETFSNTQFKCSQISMTNDHIGCKKNNATLLKKTGSIKINSFKKLQKYIIEALIPINILSPGGPDQAK